MKKLFFLFTLSILFIGACSREYTPDGGNEGENTTPPLTAYAVKDATGQYLGALAETPTNSLLRVNTREGYGYTIGQNDGEIKSLIFLYTNNKETIDFDDLYYSVFDTTLGIKDNVFSFRSSASGFPEESLLCQTQDKMKPLPVSDYVTWASIDNDYVFYSEEIQDPTINNGLFNGFKLAQCTFDETGIPKNITPPLTFMYR